MVAVVNDDELATVLSEFARTLLTDFPIQAILDHLVGRIVDVLPVSSAGVTLISSGSVPHYISASDKSALRYERLQTKIGQGPCISAFESGEAVSVPDLSVDERFPLFSPAAVSAGLAAVFTFPLRHGEGCLGALDLYRERVGSLTEREMATAQTMADVVSAYLINAQAREQASVALSVHLHNSLHDSLTGLPNRALLQERLQQAAQRAKRSHTNAAVLFADIDRFKAVNDEHGHDVGDQLLRAVAERLSALLRSGDTLARISGDEFVFLCEDLRSAADIEIVAARIDGVFAEPFIVGDMELCVTASVGMAFAGPGENISNELVINADMAMYQVKRKGGGGHQIIDMREAARSSDYQNLERELRAALIANDLHVAYQPIVRTADGTITGVEALLRWTHPTRGPILPLLMIEAAERSTLINDIGAWVLERSCDTLAGWLDEGADPSLDISVNVSARQLISGNFSEVVDRVLTKTKLDPRLLVLEMTENLLIEDTERVMDVLNGLHDLGVRLALDDFGTGYSSMSYLSRLPIDIVKIDRSFITDIAHIPGQIIVAAMSHMAQQLGMKVVAEGIETEAQHDQISLIGCDHAQGFYFGRPMTESGIETLGWPALPRRESELVAT